MFYTYSYEHLQTGASEVWKLFFEWHLVSDIQTTFRYLPETTEASLQKRWR